MIHPTHPHITDLIFIHIDPDDFHCLQVSRNRFPRRPRWCPCPVYTLTATSSPDRSIPGYLFPSENPCTRAPRPPSAPSTCFHVLTGCVALPEFHIVRAKSNVIREILIIPPARTKWMGSSLIGIFCFSEEVEFSVRGIGIEVLDLLLS